MTMLETRAAEAQRDGREVDRAFDLVLKDILSGTLPPGTKLKELELSRRLGIKRGPIREAIRRLQGRNLVLCTPNFGAWIALHSPKDVLDIYEMRESLESTAARLCAERMTEAEIEDLRQAAALRTSPYADVTSSEDADKVGFHLHLIRGSHNNAIIRTLDESCFQLLKLWRTHFPWLRHSDDVSRHDHQRIVEAIALHDGDSAELLVRNHIRRLRHVIMTKMREQNVSEVEPAQAPQRNA